MNLPFLPPSSSLSFSSGRHSSAPAHSLPLPRQHPNLHLHRNKILFPPPTSLKARPLQTQRSLPPTTLHLPPTNVRPSHPKGPGSRLLLHQRTAHSSLPTLGVLHRRRFRARGGDSRGRSSATLPTRPTRPPPPSLSHSFPLLPPPQELHRRQHQGHIAPSTGHRGVGVDGSVREVVDEESDR